ncbi:DNA-3-methyladenine glycosylase family protein [Alicyclobacillus sp. ALC3]|uniref:DNA-3-methyladenine glycosylase family protein n=1 Tax=Alicyclobacillus sp. ALC3 TaxID=2796143 RepID=UPI002377D93C|nr:DNA-3-methyladenine glycosylase [Alicyclobacillus sp. ALC3]WDL96725.1 DNA-3-methyladenine glycosylase 2 family protein [Alicyclobacillus sp. ALC3]
MDEEWIVTPPFDFRQMLRRPMSRPSKVTVIDPDTPSYTRVIRLRTRAVPVTVMGKEGTAGDPTLRLEMPDGLSSGERVEVRERVGRIFSTDMPVQGFYSHMRRYSEWSGLIERLHGLRPIQDADLFESVIKVIIGQQLNVEFAATLVERLVDFGGETVEWNSRLLPVFPSVERVAGWSYDDLRTLSFSQRKAEYVIDFARAVIDARIDLEGLRDMSDGEIAEVLMSLRGIGRWTVECFLLFGMGRRDLMPAADIGVQNAVQKLYGMERRPKEEEIRQIAEPWAPWRSYATYYLWQSLIPVS